METETKVCPTCKVEKDRSDFFKASGKSDGLQSCCKECHVRRMQKYHEGLSNSKRDAPESKHCSNCKTIKPASEFTNAKNQLSTLSCWCRSCMKEHRREKREKDPRRFLLHGAKNRAKTSGVPFNLCLEDVTIPDLCPVLGIPLKSSGGYQRDASPSIDRIRPELGYVKENVVVVSWKANRIKVDATIDELRKVADFYSKFT